MKTFAKKIFAGLIAGALIFAGIGEVSARSAPVQTENEMWAREVSVRYGVSEKEILNALEAGKRHEDIDTAAMLSKISGKSLTNVLNMKADWHDVMKRLGITREKYRAALKEVAIQDLARRSELSESTVKNLLENHYFPRDIEIAGRLAKASGKDVQEILDSKKINQRWVDVAEQLNVDKSLAEFPDERDEQPPHEKPEPPEE